MSKKKRGSEGKLRVSIFNHPYGKWNRLLTIDFFTRVLVGNIIICESVGVDSSRDIDAVGREKSGFTSTSCLQN